MSTASAEDLDVWIPPWSPSESAPPKPRRKPARHHRPYGRRGSLQSMPETIMLCHIVLETNHHVRGTKAARTAETLVDWAVMGA